MNLTDRASQLFRARAKMAEVAPKGLLDDAGWDMMLTLFLNAEDNDVLFVKQLVVASFFTPTAAMRRIARLEQAQFLKRRPDPLDKRRVIVQLTDRGRSAMIDVLEHAFVKTA